MKSMRKTATVVIWALTLLPVTVSSTIITTSGNITLPTSNTPLLGNLYSHWVYLKNNTFDLTRSLSLPTTSSLTIPMSGTRKSAIIEPSRSALIIIDMQNFFLHPEINAGATAGRNAVEPTLKMIYAFRAKGIKILWVNWGLTHYDLLTIPPAYLDGFSGQAHSPLATFNSDMGTLNDSTPIGKFLMRDSWNARPYGPLYDTQISGVSKGTDLYFHKNRMSGLWGAQTPLGTWLEENQMTTLFFGGVNTDQCVYGTLLDAYNKGYDTILVDDISATTNPQATTEMVKFEVDFNGFLTTSSLVIPAML
jgi:nicotinamidase-related amidase